jgi:hypothetical protein
MSAGEEMAVPSEQEPQPAAPGAGGAGDCVPADLEPGAAAPAAADGSAAEAVRQRGPGTAQARSASGAAPKRGAAADALRRLAANLRKALTLLLRPGPAATAAEGLHASGGQLLALFLLAQALGVAYDLYAVGWQDGRLDAFSLPSVSFWALVTLFSAWAAALAARQPDRTLLLATAGFALVCWEALAAYALALAADRYALIDRYYGSLSWVPLIWVCLAFALFAVRLCAVPGRRRRALVFLAALVTLMAPQWAVNPSARLWTSSAGAGAQAEGPDSPQSEQTLYGQMDLLDDALDAVAPGQAGVTELFTISFAGDGSQDVFLNEANGADAVMADAFGSGEHAIVLANSQAHPQERPFANPSSLQRALATMAERMNPDEDVLALILSSHGTPDHHLVVSLPPYEFDDLTPERVRSLLDEAGIRYRVIIVSACYAGGFVEPLAGDDTMVIAASGEDRTSFGCRDGAQWTDFGQAFFSEALAQTASFEGAFRLASQRIAVREAKEGLPPSQPQILVGAGIREQLRRLETRRGGRILFASRAAGGTP